MASSTDSSTDTGVNSVQEKEVNEKEVNEDKQQRIVMPFIYVVIYLSTLPITLPFMITRYFVVQARNITLVIFFEMVKVGSLGLLAIEFFILLTKSISILLFKDGNTKPLMPRMMEVYNRMADTLKELNVLPPTNETGTLIHLMLNRLPQSIWDNILPYPHPFFRGSVTQASKTKSNHLITSTEEIPNDLYVPYNDHFIAYLASLSAGQL